MEYFGFSVVTHLRPPSKVAIELRPPFEICDKTETPLEIFHPPAYITDSSLMAFVPLYRNTFYKKWKYFCQKLENTRGKLVKNKGRFKTYPNNISEYIDTLFFLHFCHMGAHRSFHRIYFTYLFHRQNFSGYPFRIWYVRARSMFQCTLYMTPRWLFAVLFAVIMYMYTATLVCGQARLGHYACRLVFRKKIRPPVFL